MPRSSITGSCCCCCCIASVMSDSMRPQRRQPTRLPHPWDSLGKNTGVSCHFLFQYMKVKSGSEVAQSCPTLSDPMDCSLPGSSIHGIFQARVLEWGAIAFSLYRLWGCKESDITKRLSPHTHIHTHTHTHGRQKHPPLLAWVIEAAAINCSPRQEI